MEGPHLPHGLQHPPDILERLRVAGHLHIVVALFRPHRQLPPTPPHRKNLSDGTYRKHRPNQDESGEGVEEIREEAIGYTHRLSVRREAAAGAGVAGGLGFFVGASERGSACGRGRKVYRGFYINTIIKVDNYT